MFDERKTSQAAAYLLKKAGGQMSHMKLIKLLYLSDRLSFDKYNFAITGDEYFSMKNGPVLSNVLDLINGYGGKGSTWNEYISDRANHTVSINQHISTKVDDLDELSESDIEVLDAIDAEFGMWDKWDLVSYCHNKEKIPEWEQLDSGRALLPAQDILAFLGKSREAIDAFTKSEEYHESFLKALHQG